MILHVLRGAGILMIALSLWAPSAGVPPFPTAGGTDGRAAIDAQCVKRCNCSGSPCRSVTRCQDGEGTWTSCCNWCKF